MYPEQPLVFISQTIDQDMMKRKIYPERKDGRRCKKNDPEPPVPYKRVVFIKRQLQQKGNTIRQQVQAVILNETNKLTSVAGKIQELGMKIIQVDDDSKHQHNQRKVNRFETGLIVRSDITGDGSDIIEVVCSAYPTKYLSVSGDYIL